MVNTYTQEINPIRSDIWLPFRNQYTEAGIKVTSSFGGQTDIQTLQLGDGTTTSSFPTMIGDKGFRFLGNQYVTFVDNHLTLGDNWSIGMLIRPKIHTTVVDKHLCSFSNGGGIILNDSTESNELSYYDGTTTVSSGVALESDRFYFVVVTKDTSNNIKFYINGDLEGTGVGTDSGFTLDYIGCDGSLGSTYIGEIRELFVFADTLVGVQVGELNVGIYRGIEDQDIFVPDVDTPLSDAELETWDGLVTWVDPLNVASLTFVAQPTLVDGDCEEVDVSSWLVSGTGTLTKQTASPFGGSRNLRITGAGSGTYARQTCCTIGTRGVESLVYRVDQVSGDSGRDNDPFGAVNLISPADWTAYNREGTIVDADFEFGGRNGTGYVEMDAITIASPSLSALTPRAGTVTTAFAQATAAAQPWQDSTSGLVRFDGTADLLASGAAAGSYDCLHNNTAGELFIVSYPVGNGGPFGNLNPSSPASGFAVFASGGKYYAYVHNGTSLIVNQVSGVLPARLNLFEWTHDSTSWEAMVDGTSIGTGSGIAFSATTAVLGTRYGNVGGTAWTMEGQIGDALVFSRQLTATERTRLRTKMAAKHSITLA